MIRKRDDSGAVYYVTLDGRFEVTRHYRKVQRHDHRNASMRRPDGWDFHDTITEATLRIDTLDEVRKRIGWREREEQIAWGRAHHWRASLGHAPIGIHEVYVEDAKGKRLGKTLIGAGTEEECVAIIERWLEHHGHGDLPRG